MNLNEYTPVLQLADQADHVPVMSWIMRGKADAPSNMQWQTIEAAKAKDRVE
jgi:hypothetical protein